MATLQDINERMRTTVFTEGEHYANVFVRELFVEPECLGVVTPGRKLSIIYARDKQVFGYNSIVIAETDSSNTIYENNRFVAIGEMCSVITFIGEGGFSTFKCYIIVNWDTTWSLNQIDGNVNNGELYFTSEINVSVASKIEFSPTIAAWLKSPEYTTKVLPATIFLTQQSDILNERGSFPLNSSNGTLTEDNTCNIYIDSQEAFENLYLNIYNATLNNKTIVNIVFDGGTYFFRYNSGNAFIDINDNVFNNVDKLTDYGYIGIGVGTWYGSPLAIDRKIIVEFNELYMNPEYRSKYSCVPLLDGGAIYTWTKNTNTIIRYNFISGHSGAWNNRGIFCDDGSNHIKLYGNLIINTNNSFSIDLRYEDNNNNNNEGNIILNNIIDGIYRFEGKQSAGVGNEPSIKGRNLLLAEHYSPQKHNICRYIEDSDMENDNVLLCCRIKEHEVLLPYDMRNKLYNLNLPEFILSHIRFINF